MTELLDDRQVEKILGIHSSTFSDLKAQTKKLCAGKDANCAAALAQIAADYAWKNPTGQLASPELEEMLIGLRLRFLAAGVRNQPTESQRKHVLHVLTAAFRLGGHTRFVWRWIQQDAERTHSVALTGQRGAPVPIQLEQAVSAAQGRMHFLDEQRGGLLQRAEYLRELSREAEFVILHVHPCDVVPVLSFAENRTRPRTIYVNHADHVFSIGLSTSDVVANIRDSGYVTSSRRRGINADRNTILPIPLGQMERTRTRADAKRSLGIPDEATVLLSVADTSKYKPIGNISFYSAVRPVLERYAQAHLVLVGPSNDDDQWEEAVRRFPNRVRLMGKREDTSVFYEAADIYLNSFPFASLTSVLEAGNFGVPLVTFFPYPEAASVLGADDIALQNCMLQATTLDGYKDALGELIEDPKRRSSLGQLTQDCVRETHCGDGWRRHLELQYDKASQVQPVFNIDPNVSLGAKDELDEELVRLHRSGGISCSLDKTFRSHMGLLPLRTKIEKWKKAKGMSKVTFARAITSEWAFARMRRSLHALLHGSAACRVKTPLQHRQQKRQPA